MDDVVLSRSQRPRWERDLTVKATGECRNPVKQALQLPGEMVRNLGLEDRIFINKH